MSRFTATPRRLARGIAIAMALAITVGPSAACGDRASDRGPADGDREAAADTDAASTADATAGDRPAARTDTLSIEGMSEPMQLRLFRTSEDFPLPFAAYVPEDLDPRADASEGTAHFTAEFGGVRNEDAFVHVFVFPDGTDLHEAVATARGYTAGRTGIPVSRGIEPVTDENPPPDLDWAMESFRFHYQGDESWHAGMVGVGQHGQRLFMIVRHYPVEYADGFGPRADIILETWRWADGSPLRERDGPGR